MSGAKKARLSQKYQLAMYLFIHLTKSVISHGGLISSCGQFWIGKVIRTRTVYPWLVR